MFEDELRKRLMGVYGHRHDEDSISVSIKIRSEGGCFDHGCCPTAWRIIQPELDRVQREHDELDRKGTSIFSVLTPIGFVKS